MLLCLSHKRTLTTLDELGENHDEKVLQWQCNVVSSLAVGFHIQVCMFKALRLCRRCGLTTYPYLSLNYYGLFVFVSCTDTYCTSMLYTRIYKFSV